GLEARVLPSPDSVVESAGRRGRYALTAEEAGMGGGRLAGKRAVISGGGAGIGREAALLFAREGAAVAVADVDARGAEATAAEIGAAGGRALAVTVDVADPKSVAAMIARPKGPSAPSTRSSTTPASCSAATTAPRTRSRPCGTAPSQSTSPAC